MEDLAIEFSHVSKNYRLCKNAKNKLFSLLFFKNRIKLKKVLNDVSFKIKKGESVAIIGKNGMGKSTILKLMLGISYPTSGDIHILQKIGGILELDSGFEKEFTGRENIYLKCEIMGFTKKYIKTIEQDIIKFADIGEYIDQPIRTYSSGMRSRLGFAISIYTYPDILLVDEVFSVGDFAFKNKCIEKVREIVENKNTTFVLVTHSSEIAEEFCTRGILINNGGILFDGDIKECTAKYLQL